MGQTGSNTEVESNTKFMYLFVLPKRIIVIILEANEQVLKGKWSGEFRLILPLDFVVRRRQMSLCCLYAKPVQHRHQQGFVYKRLTPKK